MKIKNAIFENKQYFETIGKIHASDQLSVMDAYRINRLVKKLNELQEEYSELKKKIFDQHGTPGKKKELSKSQQKIVKYLHPNTTILSALNTIWKQKNFHFRIK